MPQTCSLTIAGQTVLCGDRRAGGEERVARLSGQHARFAVVVLLRSGRNTIAIVPNSIACEGHLICRGIREDEASKLIVNGSIEQISALQVEGSIG